MTRLFQGSSETTQLILPEETNAQLADMTVENESLKAELKMAKDSIRDSNLKLAELVRKCFFPQHIRTSAFRGFQNPDFLEFVQEYDILQIVNHVCSCCRMQKRALFPNICGGFNLKKL